MTRAPFQNSRNGYNRVKRLLWLRVSSIHWTVFWGSIFTLSFLSLVPSEDQSLGLQNWSTLILKVVRIHTRIDTYWGLDWRLQLSSPLKLVYVSTGVHTRSGTRDGPEPIRTSSMSFLSGRLPLVLGVPSHTFHCLHLNNLLNQFRGVDQWPSSSSLFIRRNR